MSDLDPPDKHVRAAELIGSAYAEYSRELKNFLARRSQDAHSSEDLMQEVYMELLRYAPRTPVREPQAYLFKIAWNVVNRFNARARREPVAHESVELDRLANRAARAPTSAIEAQIETEQRILQALRDLPPLYGAVLILSRRDGLSYLEIAKELRISTHTVRRYLTRAVAHLKQHSANQSPGNTHESTRD